MEITLTTEQKIKSIKEIMQKRLHNFHIDDELDASNLYSQDCITGSSVSTGERVRVYFDISELECSIVLTGNKIVMYDWDEGKDFPFDEEMENAFLRYFDGFEF